MQQDHFKYDQYPVLDTVIMGNARLYEIMKEKEVIYAKEDFTDEDGIKASELEAEFATLNGWEAESDAASLLNGLGIETELHYNMMSELTGAQKVKFFLHRLCSAIRTFFFWMSLPTTWIWMRSHGWKNS